MRRPNAVDRPSVLGIALQRFLRAEACVVGPAFARRPTRIDQASTPTATKAMIQTLSLLTIALLFGGMTQIGRAHV